MASQVQLSPPRQPYNLKLDPERRRLIFGMTGKGKTYWARFLDRAWVRKGWQVLIIDQDQRYVNTKKGETYAEKPDKSLVNHPWDITKTGRLHPTAPVQIFHPEIPGWQDPKFLKLSEEVLERGNIVYHLDDMFGVVEGYHIPLVLRKLWTSGRKNNIPIQALIQSARGFDRIIIKQSEDIDIFFMQMASEREYLAKELGHSDLMKAAPEFAHWAYVQGQDTISLVGALPPHEVR